jgi:hypothetical protein
MKLIAIDPDLRKCGFADWNGEKFINIDSTQLWDLFSYLIHVLFLTAKKDFIVLIEDPRLRKGTWHAGGKGMARNVGKCEAVAIILEDFCKAHGIRYRMISPAGYSKLFANEGIFKQTTGWQGRTNKDARAAAAMCWIFKDERF